MFLLHRPPWALARNLTSHPSRPSVSKRVRSSFKVHPEPNHLRALVRVIVFNLKNTLGLFLIFQLKKEAKEAHGGPHPKGGGRRPSVSALFPLCLHPHLAQMGTGEEFLRVKSPELGLCVGV